MNNAENQENKSFEDIVNDLKPFVQRLKQIHDMAVVAYTPLVNELCSRKAERNEVELMLDWLLMYAGDNRMLLLYKQVCRTFWQSYPDSIAFYIMEYRKEYDPDSLIGTEYEYLLHADEYDEEDQPERESD